MFPSEGSRRESSPCILFADGPFPHFQIQQGSIFKSLCFSPLSLSPPSSPPTSASVFTSSLTLLLPSYKQPYDYIGSTQIIQGNNLAESHLQSLEHVR